MKTLSIFLISLGAFQIMFSTFTVTEARPMPQILVSWSNSLVNVVFLGKPIPPSEPTPPMINPPKGPGFSSDPKVKCPPKPYVIASELSDDSPPNQNNASTA